MADDHPPFSVLLPTYAGDDAGELSVALESCFDQPLVPEEVLVVADGSLTDALESTLSTWQDRYPNVCRRYSLPENSGLGNALREGVKACRNDLIARADADDINVAGRFERQVTYLTEHPDIDIVGGYIAEFECDPDDPVTVREVPTDHDSIRRKARFRSPMNHGTVCFRRQAVLEAGNYRPVVRMEDYDLWVRMLLSGASFANLPAVLVKVRAGPAMAARRGGLEYARAEVRRQIEFYRRGFTSLPVFLFNLATRTVFRFLPNAVRSAIYRHVARRDADG
ncbi:glycosyltransferase [Halorhabdus sp. BNX81]|uniref:glycosyltransferase n=1 Tax=Halorhabdus sp. BNX81 TaxID=2980181 RepID=UPI0023DD0F4A|nr:glycosyltransferase [Halorhabdus sp. BNX81]WEL20552.1 Glycosyl transferase family 2 [Halorhabdus sp. BNX81]